MKQEISAAQGILGEVTYGAGIQLQVLLPEENWESFAARIVEVTGGQLEPQRLGVQFRGVPMERN
jgi:hypothetical protein